MPTRNLRDGQLVIKDGGQSPQSVTVALDDGDLEWVETRTPVGVKDRGTLSHLRNGDQVPVFGRFTARFREFVTTGSGGDVSPYEALTQSGEASDWESTNADGGGVYTVELELTIANPQSGGSAERVTFSKVALERITFRQGDPYDALAVRFQDFEVTPTIVKAS